MNKKKPEKQNKRNKTINVLLTILMIVAAAVFLVSGWKLFTIIRGYSEGRNTYEKIREEAGIPAKTDPGQEETEEKEFQPDFAALKKINPDCAAYLHCEEVCSYPVVRSCEQEYYLTHLFDGTENNAGALFMAAKCTGIDDRNCIIYGHNMKDGSMFGQLYKYQDEAFYKEHPVFDVYAEDRHEQYEVVSAFRTSIDSFVYQTDFESEASFLDFQVKAAMNSPYPTVDDSTDPDGHMITLSTCTWDSSDTERFVVMLRRINKTSLDD